MRNWEDYVRERLSLPSLPPERESRIVRALAGVGIGLAAALALAHLLEALLFGVTPFDPASYAATAIALLLVAAVACFVPARRALRLDPLVALRHE